MSLRISKLVSVALLLASAFGCAESAAPAANGRLDLVVRPESSAASDRPVRGHFAVRSLDRADAAAQVAVDSASETRSLALAAGTYAVEWQPDVSVDEPFVTSASLQSPCAIVVAAGQVATLNVRVALPPAAETQLATLDLRAAH